MKMNMIFPAKLKKGDEIRVIAPSNSFKLISDEVKAIANDRFAELGLKVSFGKNTDLIDDFLSSSIESRVADLHAAFEDTDVKAIFTVLGGNSSNQLLPYLDWKLIKANPKIFCGFSDITALNNAILAKTGLVTYSGPHYSTFGQKLGFEYTLEAFVKCLMEDEGDGRGEVLEVVASGEWSDDLWFLDQEKREFLKNDGFWSLNEGEAEGNVVGGHVGTLNLLKGSEFYPKMDGVVLFVEELSSIGDFDRELEALTQLESFEGVRGVVIGRFPKKVGMTRELLQKIVDNKEALKGIPVIGNVDFGHTDPKITFPVGGKVALKVGREEGAELKFLEW